MQGKVWYAFAKDSGKYGDILRYPEDGEYEKTNNIEYETTLSLPKLKHIKFKLKEGEYIAVLIDHEGYEIVKGYGDSPLTALDDLHQNLI